MVRRCAGEGRCVLATTSGAADSAGKTDWRALAGRSVTLWPDNDEAGRRYADAVAETAMHAQGGTVRLHRRRGAEPAAQGRCRRLAGGQPGRHDGGHRRAGRPSAWTKRFERGGCVDG
jgi:hypothetical protein